MLTLLTAAWAHADDFIDLRTKMTVAPKNWLLAAKSCLVRPGNCSRALRFSTPETVRNRLATAASERRMSQLSACAALLAAAVCQRDSGNFKPY